MTPSHPMKPRLPQRRSRPASTRGRLAEWRSHDTGTVRGTGTCQRSAGAKPSEAMALWSSALCAPLRRMTKSEVPLSLELPHAGPASGC